jgi:hypothetical protein
MQQVLAFIAEALEMAESIPARATTASVRGFSEGFVLSLLASLRLDEGLQDMVSSSGFRLAAIILACRSIPGQGSNPSTTRPLELRASFSRSWSNSSSIHLDAATEMRDADAGDEWGGGWGSCLAIVCRRTMRGQLPELPGYANSPPRCSTELPTA